MLFLLHGGAEAETFLGYNLPHWHALINDAPAALLVAAVGFELLGLATQRRNFFIVSFWTLVTGALGAGAAVITGLLASDDIDHGEAIHQIMERHESWGIATLCVFGVLALWRIFRERKLGQGERIAAFLVGVAGTVILVNTGRMGGQMTLDHAAGTPTAALELELKNRELGHHHEEGEEADHDETTPAAPGDSVAGDSATAPAGHTHPPGTPPHQD